MAASRQIILAFDAYGTLLSTASIAKQLASYFGEAKATSIAAEWRKYQLEYTWRLNSMNVYGSFSDVTRRSLQHAVAEAGEKLGDSDVQKLMESYNTLNLFPDVPPVFDHLKAASNIHAVIFSNGDKAMISATMAESPEISPYASLFKDIVVVGPVKKFKPHMDTYTHLIKSVNKEEKPEDVWLISGNPFDIVGANHAGMSTCWVDRSGGGWADSLVEGDKGKPTVIVKGLNEVVEKIQAHSK